MWKAWEWDVQIGERKAGFSQACLLKVEIGRARKGRDGPFQNSPKTFVE